METNVHYTVVGAFVIFLLAATIFAIIWLSSGLSFDQYATYKIIMTESISGLNIDAPVEYNGVSVGAVKSVQLNKQNPQQVELLISIQKSTPITQATVATLTTRGITGITFIALKDTGSDLQPLTLQHGEQYLVIKTAPSFFVRIDKELSDLSQNFKQISIKFQELFNKENLESIQETLLNLKEITGTLEKNTKKMDTILENTSRASQQFAPLIQSGVGTMRMLETETLPAAYRLLTNLDEVSRTLSEVTLEIKQNPSILIRGVNRPALGPGESQ